MAASHLCRSLKRLDTLLYWIGEHYHSARHHQKANEPRDTERELVYLEDAITQARAQFEELRGVLGVL